jgi:hypothetical protein
MEPTLAPAPRGLVIALKEKGAVPSLPAVSLALHRLRRRPRATARRGSYARCLAE